MSRTLILGARGHGCCHMYVLFTFLGLLADTTLQNRKLRHLQGITIRNLTLVQSPLRARGKTIDDEGLPSTLQTPAKALAHRETRKLEHTRSSAELRTINESALHESESAVENGVAAQPAAPRPTLARLRRRSTMEWANASPLARQKKLEDVAEGRMADTFFSLHVVGVGGQFVEDHTNFTG